MAETDHHTALTDTWEGFSGYTCTHKHTHICTHRCVVNVSMYVSVKPLGGVLESFLEKFWCLEIQSCVTFVFIRFLQAKVELSLKTRKVVLNYFNLDRTAHYWEASFSIWFKRPDNFLCAKHLVVQDYSADGDYLVELFPHSFTVSPILSYRLSVVEWVQCQILHGCFLLWKISF